MRAQKQRAEKRPVEDVREFKEKLIHVNRVAKVVKGGRRFSFSALVVLGNGSGTVGLGFGKANEVSEAIRKGIQDAKGKLFKVPMKGDTIPYAIMAEEGAAKVLLKPASPGTGIIAGGAVRAIIERAGIKDILTKNLGTKNQINTARATIKGLQDLRSPEHFLAVRAFAAGEPDLAEEESDKDQEKRQRNRQMGDKKKKKRSGKRSGPKGPGEMRAEEHAAEAAPAAQPVAETPAAPAPAEPTQGGAE
jgi:small subunit ribosomal protein S5